MSVLPVKDLDTLAPAGEELKRADYLVYTRRREQEVVRRSLQPSGMSATT